MSNYQKTINLNNNIYRKNNQIYDIIVKLCRTVLVPIPSSSSSPFFYSCFCFCFLILALTREL